MAIVSLQDVTLGFSRVPLLDGVGFQVEDKDRVCLVGRNGTGKTTVLRVMFGEVIPDSGEVKKQHGARVAYLAQQVEEGTEGLVYDVVMAGLEGIEVSQKHGPQMVESTLSKMALDKDARFENLSGGLKRRVLLARAIVSEPDLLLLDEPTNHMDIDSIVWLEGFLSRFPGAILFVSHDRMFSEKLATRILDLDRGVVQSYAGSYSEYTKRKRAALESEEKQNARFDRKLAEEEVWIRKGVRERRTRNEGRVRALFKMREEARARRKKVGAAQFELQKAGRTAKKVFVAEDLTFEYAGGAPIVESFSGTIYRGEKVGVIGRNGMGKTTLLNLLLGKLAPVGGTVERAENLDVAFLDQLRGALDTEKTVIENVLPAGDTVQINGRPKHIVSYLKEFLFSSERAKTPVWVLSGGERNRLLLAKLFTRPSNILVLDEPTNDLDAETLDLLEERLAEYDGTVLLVSHDRAFLNNVVTSTLVFEGDGRIGEYAGGYDDWIAQKEAGAKKVVAKTKTASTDTHKERKNAFNRPRLTFSQKRELVELPRRIETLEDEQSELRKKLADPDFYKNSGDEVPAITKRLDELDAELLANYAKWEELEAIEAE